MQINHRNHLLVRCGASGASVLGMMYFLTVKDLAVMWRAAHARMQLQGLWQVKETTHDFDWVVVVEYLVSSSGVKTLGMTLLLYPAMAAFCIVTLTRALLGVSLDMIFRVKTHDLTFDGWIQRWRRLHVVPFLEASLLENLFSWSIVLSKDGWCLWSPLSIVNHCFHRFGIFLFIHPRA
jgi:hypothetical protein